MSAKNRKQSAKIGDVYPTPVKLVRAGFERFISVQPDFSEAVTSFLEPGAGLGPFCKMASVYLPSLCKNVGVEKTPPKDRYTYSLVETDFLTYFPKAPIDFIATNPPFVLAEEFIYHARSMLAKDNSFMLFLMRVGILGSKKRRDLWDKVNLREVWLIRPRPSFQKEGGSDASEYAFFLMDKQLDHCSKNVHLSWLDWDVEDALIDAEADLDYSLDDEA